jgi:hypothetical protein
MGPYGGDGDLANAGRHEYAVPESQFQYETGYQGAGQVSGKAF